MDICGYETKLLASLRHSLSSSSSCQSRKDTVHLISVYSFSTNINSNNSIRCFTVQLEYLCYNIHIFWNTYKNISRVNIPHFYYVSRLFMYNQTMIEMNRGKYLKRIKDIQLYKQQRNKALQMAHTTFMSEYKREYKYCTLH